MNKFTTIAEAQEFFAKLRAKTFYHVPNIKNLIPTHEVTTNRADVAKGLEDLGKAAGPIDITEALTRLKDLVGEENLGRLESIGIWTMVTRLGCIAPEDIVALATGDSEYANTAIQIEEFISWSDIPEGIPRLTVDGFNSMTGAYPFPVSVIGEVIRCVMGTQTEYDMKVLDGRLTDRQKVIMGAAFTVGGVADPFGLTTIDTLRSMYFI